MKSQADRTSGGQQPGDPGRLAFRSCRPQCSPIHKLPPLAPREQDLQAQERRYMAADSGRGAAPAVASAGHFNLRAAYNTTILDAGQVVA